METSPHEKQLASIRNQITATRASMETAQGRWLKNTERFLTTEYQKLFQAALRSSRIEQSAPPAEMQTLRAEFATILASLPALVNEYLNTHKLWAHHLRLGEEDRPGRYEMYGSRPPFALGDVVRSLFTPLGILLVDTNLVDKVSQREWELDEDGLPHYTGAIEWSTEMKHDLGRYSMLYNKLLKLNAELEQVMASIRLARPWR